MGLGLHPCRKVRAGGEGGYGPGRLGVRRGSVVCFVDRHETSGLGGKAQANILQN